MGRGQGRSRIRRLALALALVASGSAFGASLASAQTYYVSPTGSGIACTQAQPCAIEQGTSVSPGSEVVVLPGQYTVSTGLSSLNTANIHGVDGQPRPTISSTYGFAAWSLGSGSANMTFRHIEIETTGGSGIELSGNGTSTVEDVVIRSTGAGGSGCTPVLTGGGAVTFKNSICRGSDRGLGVNCAGCSDTVNVRNVTAIGGTYGLAFSSPPGSATNTTVNATNVIARQTGGTNDVSAIASATNSNITINLDHSNYATREAVANCSTLPCTASVTDPSTSNNQTAAPVFVDATNGDFHEAVGSPTVNAGANDALNGTADIDGQDRTIDTTTDIGADELGLPTTIALSCSPGTVTLPSSSTCTATATDPSVSPTAPAGPVAFSTAANGSFTNGGTCTLAPSGPGSASCALSYTPMALGSHALTAITFRDPTHEGSSATASVTATPVPGVTPAVKKKCKKKKHRAASARKKCKKKRRK